MWMYIAICYTYSYHSCNIYDFVCNFCWFPSNLCESQKNSKLRYGVIIKLLKIHIVNIIIILFYYSKNGRMLEPFAIKN